MPAQTKIIKRGQGHSYELDGRPVQGVTTILDNSVPKPALVGWAARTVAEYVVERLTINEGVVTADTLISDLRAYNDTRKWPEKLGVGLPRIGLAKVLGTVQYAERDAAKNRGTEVHRLAELLAAGKEIDVPEELEGHVNSYLRFLEEWDPTDALLERVVVNRRWGYMGKFDMIATLPELGRTLVDIKTSRSGPYPETALQLAGYRYAETILDPDGEAEEAMPPVEACAVLWVRSDGYDLYRFGADESVYRIFLYCKQVAEWLGGPAAAVKSDALRLA